MISVLAYERKLKIVDFLKRNQTATTEELVNHFGVSGSTIRRDLDSLAKMKLIVRTHNGAMILAPNVDRSFAVSYNIMKDEKQQIAKAAARLIDEKDFVAISGGSTAYYLAEELITLPIGDLTILTNSINIMTLILESSKSFGLIVAGGVPMKGSYECVGEITLSTIRRFNIDKFFMGVNGVSIEGGISFNNQEEAAVAREICNRSNKVVVMADSTKFGITKRMKVMDVEDVDVFVTDRLDEKRKEEFAEVIRTLITD